MIHFKIIVIPTVFTDLTVNTPVGSASGATVTAVASQLDALGFTTEVSTSTDGALKLLSVGGESIDAATPITFVVTTTSGAGNSTAAAHYAHETAAPATADPSAGAMAAIALLVAFVAAR